jgi:hypothetical protein
MAETKRNIHDIEELFSLSKYGIKSGGTKLDDRQYEPQSRSR